MGGVLGFPELVCKLVSIGRVQEGVGMGNSLDQAGVQAEQPERV